MPQTYSFHGFVLKPEELSLYHKNQRLELGLKGFKLLVALVENQGKLVPKDELIAAAWGEQIVTDGTLSKQMERIRQVLCENCPEITFIETIRGIGYKFIVEVKTHINRKKGLAKWQKAIASVSIIPLVLFLYFYPFTQTHTDLKEKHVMPFNIAVIPAAAGDDYMNVGGLNYLASLLGKNPRIYHTSPRTSWFKHEDKHKLAIELEDQKNLDYVLLVNIKDNNDYKIAALELRNTNQFNKQEIIKARSFKQLFADINTWMLLQLEIENNSKDYIAFNNMSADSFAAESFLRGKKESSTRNYSKAIQYFKTAITQDPDFNLAMLDLIYAQVKSNDYAAAEALLNTMETTKQLSDDLKLYLLINKASLLINTLRASEVEAFIGEAIKLAEKTNDTNKMVFALFYQGEMYKEMGNIEQSIQSTFKQKKILEKNSKNKTDLMRVANNLAHAYYGTNQLQKAKQQIEPAIVWFEKTNHMVGKLNSYGLLASINYELANYVEGTLVINKALALQSQVEDKHLILNALEINGYLQLAQGLHDDCRKTIKEIESLTKDMGIEYPLYFARTLNLSLGNQTYNLALLKQDGEDLNRLTKPQEEDILFIRQTALSAIIKSSLILENYDLAKSQIDELIQISKDDKTQGITLYQIHLYEWMYKTGQSKDAKDKLNQLLNTLINNKQNRLALIVAYLLLDMDEKQGLENTQALLNQINYIKPFPYPYLKYKAKLAAHNGDYFEASTLMQEMKNTSNEWFNTDDQVLMDSYFQKIKQ